jgi:hypothetical protein
MKETVNTPIRRSCTRIMIAGLLAILASLALAVTPAWAGHGKNPTPAVPAAHVGHVVLPPLPPGAKLVMQGTVKGVQYKVYRPTKSGAHFSKTDVICAQCGGGGGPGCYALPDSGWNPDWGWDCTGDLVISGTAFGQVISHSVSFSGDRCAKGAASYDGAFGMWSNAVIFAAGPFAPEVAAGDFVFVGVTGCLTMGFVTN